MIAEVATRGDLGAVFWLALLATGVWVEFLAYRVDRAKREILKALEDLKK